MRFFLACEQSFDQLFDYPRLRHEQLPYWNHPELASAKARPALAIVPLQKAIFKALEGTPSLTLFVLRLERAGVSVHFDKSEAGSVTALHYQVRERALPWHYAGKLPPALASSELEQPQEALLTKQGYTELIDELRKEVKKPGRDRFDAQ